MLGVGHIVGCNLFAVNHLGVPLAKVYAAGQLADDHKIDSVTDDALLQRRGVGKLGEKPCGTEVCEKTELASYCKQCLFGTDRGVYVIPFRTSHRTEKNRVRALALRHSLLGYRHSEFIYGASADIDLGVIEFMPVFFCDCVKHLDRLRNDLGAYSVALE